MRVIGWFPLLLNQSHTSIGCLHVWNTIGVCRLFGDGGGRHVGLPTLRCANFSSLHYILLTVVAAALMVRKMHQDKPFVTYCSALLPESWHKEKQLFFGSLVLDEESLGLMASLVWVNGLCSLQHFDSVCWVTYAPSPPVDSICCDTCMEVKRELLHYYYNHFTTLCPGLPG